MSLADEADALIAALAAGDVRRAFELADRLRRSSVDCGRCRKISAATPLDLVLVAIGWTAKQFAEATGLPLRTVIRAAKGERVSLRVARRLAKITHLPVETFRRPDEIDLALEGQQC